MTAQARYALVQEEKNQLRTFCTFGYRRSIGPSCFVLAVLCAAVATLSAFVPVLDTLLAPETPAALKVPDLSFLVFFKINPT